jgi:3-oxoacyl-[acyl-carrier-protein] synthase II
MDSLIYTTTTPPPGSMPVCITGMGLCLPVGKGVDTAAAALLASRHAIGIVSSFDASQLNGTLVSEFDPQDRGFGLPAEALHTLDRASWFALAALIEAVKHAGLEGRPYPADRVGVVLGSSHAGIQHVERAYQALRAGQTLPMHWLEAMGTDQSAAAVARHLGAKGPRAVVSSACASSNTAVGVALDWLVTSQADCVVVVGTDTVSPSILAGFSALRAVSPSPAAPFSNPPGITLGEGGGVVVMEREADARRRGVRPIMWVRGYGLSGDAYHETATDIEGAGVEAAMRAALADAGLAPDAIDYVSAHGTGTDANDIPEAHATARVLGMRTPLSSPKSFLGHTLGASGVVELIVTSLFVQRGLIPPTRNFQVTRAGCPALNYVPNAAQAHPVRHFLCNNYGFGGNNSSLVISTESGRCAFRQPAEAVLLVGQGAVGGFGWGSDAMFERLWAGDTLPGERPDAGPAILGVQPTLAGRKFRGNSRASPMIRSAIGAVGEALRQAAGEELVALDPGRCALVAGVSHGALRHVEKFMASAWDEGLEWASATHFPLTTMNAAAGQVSIVYGVKGYNTTFCGAGGALHYAHQVVGDGRQDRAILFGADEVSTLAIRALAQIPGLDAPAVAPLGEGAGALVLERATAVRARGGQAWAWLRSVACAQPCAIGAWSETLERAARLALQRAGVEPTEVVAVVSIVNGPPAYATAETEAVARIWSELPARVTAAAVGGLSASALLMLNVQLAAQVLRRGETPPSKPGARPSRLARCGPVLVLHPALGGECHAVVVDQVPLS